MKRTTEYVPFLGKACDIVTIDIEWFLYRNDEAKLPKIGAFCKKCARETAKPVFPILMNGKPAYALRCEKCGSEYPMYKSMYIERYIGYDLKNGGHINPTHGVKSVFAAMDRKAKNYYNGKDTRVEKKMCEYMGWSAEEYGRHKKEWDKKEEKSRKKFKAEQANSNAKWEDEERENESAKRKELIENGVLKYVKNVGLVNTETEEVIKL